MAVEASYWMDRVRSAEPLAKRVVWPLLRTAAANQDSRSLITARSALLARQGLSQDELHGLARSRRQEALRSVRSRRLLVTAGLLSAGVAVALVGSQISSQMVLLIGFGLVLLGALAGCTVLAAMMEPPAGELGIYLQADEAPATAEEITALSRATQADPELDQLINQWWRQNGAPIRRRDLALVQAYQQIKRDR